MIFSPIDIGDLSFGDAQDELGRKAYR